MGPKPKLSPRGVDLEIVESNAAKGVNDRGAIKPFEVIINGESVLTPMGYPVEIHPLLADDGGGRPCAMATVTFFVRSLKVHAEERPE